MRLSTVQYMYNVHLHVHTNLNEVNKCLLELFSGERGQRLLGVLIQSLCCTGELHGREEGVGRGSRPGGHGHRQWGHLARKGKEILRLCTACVYMYIYMINLVHVHGN